MKYAIFVTRGRVQELRPSPTHFDGFQVTAQCAENRLDEIVPPAKWETVKRKHLGRYAENATQYVDAWAFEFDDVVQFDKQSNRFTRTEGSAA